MWETCCLIMQTAWVYFVCLGLTSLLNIWCHIVTVSTWGSGTLTNVLPHRNAMSETQGMTPHPVTVYRHGADLSLCYPLMWNVKLEYTATHSRSSTHTSERSIPDAVMVVVSRTLDMYTYQSSLEPGTCGVRIHYIIRSPISASYL